MQALHITAKTAIPPGGKVEIDAGGKPTGVVRADGNVATLAGLERRLPEPSFEKQVGSTHAISASSIGSASPAFSTGAGATSYPPNTIRSLRYGGVAV